MDNDHIRDEFTEVMALVQDQMDEVATMGKKRAALQAKASVAEGTVEVTVDAQGTVVKTVIDESYRDQFDFDDLGGYVTSAARAAAQEVQRRAQELFNPLTERRQTIASMSGTIDLPDFSELLSRINPATEVVDTNTVAPEDDDEDHSTYPTVKE
jgi:DNA-binding protein YbaB